MANRNKNLNAAKRAKNDEFYTRYEDIEKELFHYKDFFKGKVVYCNCDDFRWSNFVRYFKDNFHTLRLKKLYASNYDIGQGAYKYSYNGKVEIYIKCNGNGDFRTEECRKLLNASDIIVTNPPFSLWRDFFGWIQGKDFIVIANLNSTLYNEIFPSIQDKSVRFGYTKLHFNGEGAFRFETENGLKTLGNAHWFTTFPVKSPKKLELAKSIAEGYEKIDEADAINADKVADIPKDYFGVVATSMYVLCYDLEGWDIVGKIVNPHIDGKPIYKRILIRRRLQGGS